MLAACLGSPLARGQADDEGYGARLERFFQSHDEAVLRKDWSRLYDEWNLDGRKRAEAFLARYTEVDLRSHDSRLVTWDRIGDVVCVHVHATILARSSRGSDVHSVFDNEIGEDHLFLLQRDGETFRILKAEPVRGSVRFENPPGRIACQACNFYLEPEPGWFHVHHHGASVRSAEKIQLHHVSGKVTLELQVIERFKAIDLREEIDWDNKISLIDAAPEGTRVIREGPLRETSRNFRAYEKDVAAKDLAGEELRIWRIYRARENVLYAMTAFGQAEAFDVLLSQLERMFHSFDLLDPRVSPKEQMDRMLARHRPQLAVGGGDYSNERNHLFMRGPSGWTLTGNSTGARWIHLDEEEHEVASIELSTSPPNRAGWSDPARIQRMIRAWELDFQKRKDVQRGTLELIHPIRSRQHSEDPEDLLSTLCYKADYAYETTEGASRRIRMYLVPVGQLLHRVLCETDVKRFESFEAFFDKSVRTLRVVASSREGKRPR